MQQKIVYNDRPTSINNKNDAIKAIYQKGLKKAALEQSPVSPCEERRKTSATGIAREDANEMTVANSGLSTAVI